MTNLLERTFRHMPSPIPNWHDYAKERAFKLFMLKCREKPKRFYITVFRLFVDERINTAISFLPSFETISK
jgi:hypothetical protein